MFQAIASPHDWPPWSCIPDFSFFSPIKISEAIEDPYAYTQLTDSILQLIMMSEDSRLNKVGGKEITKL